MNQKTILSDDSLDFPNGTEFNKLFLQISEWELNIVNIIETLHVRCCFYFKLENFLNIEFL